MVTVRADSFIGRVITMCQPPNYWRMRARIEALEKRSVTPDMLRDLYMDVLGASSPRRGAQYVAAMMYRMETGGAASEIADREAFVEHENQLYRDTWNAINDRRQNGYPNG